MFKPRGPYCQSCGMPLSKDEKGGGTNEDGSKTTEYCSHCYQNGKYTNPDITFDEMKKSVITKMKDVKVPGIMAAIFVKDLNKLKRWSIASN